MPFNQLLIQELERNNLPMLAFYIETWVKQATEQNLENLAIACTNAVQTNSINIARMMRNKKD